MFKAVICIHNQGGGLVLLLGYEKIRSERRPIKPINLKKDGSNAKPLYYFDMNQSKDVLEQ